MPTIEISIGNFMVVAHPTKPVEGMVLEVSQGQ
jgi:hypothetical protein